MGDISGHYRGQDLSWLRAHKVELQNALTAITNSQSYSIAGRQLTLANYSELLSALSGVTAEIARQEAILNEDPDPTTASRVTYINFGGA